MAFVTHTGNNGLLEAIHYRVPMVGLPIYMNQEDNLSRLVEKGIAVGVTKWSDADEIYHAITRVISNERSVSQPMQLLLKSIFTGWYTGAPLSGPRIYGLLAFKVKFRLVPVCVS